MSLARQRELVVLATLSAHPMHGYALAEVLAQGLGPAVDLKRPALYAILKRFEERGWLEGDVEQEGARPQRSVFRVTEAGEEALAELAATCAGSAVDPALPLAAVLAHLDFVPPRGRRSMVELNQATRRERAAALEPYLEHPGPLGIALRLMHAQAQLELAALDEVAEWIEGETG